MKDFKVKFRGVRGSFPVANEKFLRYGGNTACVEINVGGHLIVLDAGTGIVNLGDELVTGYISSGLEPKDREPIKVSILLSHIHQDHLLGLTFFKPLHLKSTELKIYGVGSQNSDLLQNLSDLFFGKTFPLNLSDIACKYEVNNICEDYAILFKPKSAPELVLKKDLKPEEEDVVVTFYKSYVHPQDGVLVYKISYKGKSVVYATDKECYFGGDKKFIKFAKNCDLLIHDSQYTSEDYLNLQSPKQGYGHSTFDMALETQKQAQAKNLAFFHYDPSYNDSMLDRIKELYTTTNKNVIMSYEGLELEVE